MPSEPNQRPSAEAIAKLIKDRRVIVFVGTGASVSNRKGSAGKLPRLPSKRSRIESSPLARMLRHLSLWPVSAVVSMRDDDLVECIFGQVDKRFSTVLTPWELAALDSVSIRIPLIKIRDGALRPPTSVGPASWKLESQLSELLIARVCDLFSSELRVFIDFKQDDPVIFSALSDRKRGKIKAPCLFVGAMDASRASCEYSVDLPSHALESFFGAVSEVLPRPAAAAPLVSAHIEAYRRFVRNVARWTKTVSPDHALLIDELPLRVKFQRNVTSVLLGEARSSPPGHQTIEFPWPSVIGQLKSHRVLMVVGEAGSGKSTLLKALVGRMSLQPDPNAFLPIFLRAPDLAEADIVSHWSLIDRAESRTGFAGLGATVRKHLETGTCVLVIDGLDELSRENMQRTLRALREFGAIYPDSRCIASSRWHGYESLLADNADLYVTVSPLRQRDVQRFISHWFSTNSRGKELCSLLSRNADVSDLASRPLFLNLLVYCWNATNSTPLTVWSLCRQASELLFGAWDWEKGIFRANRFSAMLHSIALSSVSGTMLSRGVNSISTTQALDCLQASSHEPLSLENAAALLEECEARSGLFVRTSVDHWSFTHDLFRHYFASEFILNREPKELGAAISRSRHALDWETALALALSSSEAGARKVRRIIEELPQIGLRAVTKQAAELSSQPAQAKVHPEYRSKM